METEILNLMSRAMDAYDLRTKTLTGNIANLDTPGYERVSVSFEDQLAAASHQIESPDRLRPIEARVEIEDAPPVLEDEMMELSDTQMRTQLVTRALREHFGLIRTGITGRSQG
jgi:flagellar basal-body rod protein FlgB